MVGMVVGMVLVIITIMMGGSIGGFIDIPSLIVVLGGTLCATLVTYPMSKMKILGKVFGKVMKNSSTDPKTAIENISQLANKARKEGLLSLEEANEGIQDEFLKKGIMLVVDGTDPDLVRTLMETELDYMLERHKLGQSFLETMGSLAPAFGMVGTLIGLINMLANLSDPSAIGPAMAVALITTFYGSLFANLFFIPMAAKLKIKSEEEFLEKSIVVEGILSIQAGENPRIIQEKLKAFLDPEVRKTIGEGE